MPRRTRAKLPVKEGALEERFGQELAAKGWKYWKQSGLGRAGRPDRHLIGPNGASLHIEWKRPGEVPTPLQAGELDDLEDMGHRVACCDSLESARLFVRFYAIGEPLEEQLDSSGKSPINRHGRWHELGWRARWRREHPAGKALPPMRSRTAVITVSIRGLRGR